MARWTATTEEIKQVSKISLQLPIGGIIRVKLVDGQIMEGVMRRNTSGNNAGEGGWKYYGEVEIENISGRRWVVDYLDIESVTNIWPTHSKEYEEKGLVTIWK